MTKNIEMHSVTELELANVDGGNLWTEAGALYLGVIALACPPCAIVAGVAAAAVGVAGLLMD